MRLLPAALCALVASLPGGADARIWNLAPDGAGDAPTIAAALDSAAAGDTLVLAPGTYPAHDLEWPDGVSLRGATGDPADAAVDAGGVGRIARGIGLGAGTTFDAVTFTGGRREGTCAGDPGTGTYCMGGAWLLLDGAPVFSRCVFRGNHADDNGGAVASVASAPRFTACRFEANDATHGAAITFVAQPASGAAPVLEHCVFTGNAALADAGAVYAYLCDPSFTRCTFHANRCGQEAAAILWHSATPGVVDRCVFAFGRGGAAIVSGVPGAAPVLACCDVFGNEGGDWVGALAGQEGAAGNLATDPLFCDPEAGDVRLHEGSPCAGAGTCGGIGAAGVACGPAAAAAAFEHVRWGRLKAAYRTLR